MKKILSIAAIGILALPLVSGALTVRTEHRASSGGVTVAEGGATVTGDESSSVNVQTIISGTHGRVEVTTEKDGVTTTETHDLNVSGNDGTLIISPPPSTSPDTSGRTPRESRGVIAVQAANQASGNTNTNSHTVQVQTGSVVSARINSTNIVLPIAKRVQSSVLAIASTNHASVSSFIDIPMPVIHMPQTVIAPNTLSKFLAKIFAMFGISA